MSSLVWLELERGAPDHNLRELRKCAAPGTKMCAVVKSNAYGHGVVPMVKLLESADWFGVNSLEEALEIRALGEKRPVLVLGHVPLSALGEAAAHELDLILYNLESLDALARLQREPGRPIRVHLKVETGTGRQGVLPEEIPTFVARLRGLAGAELVGVSTHFANIEDTLNHGYAERQIAQFQRALQILKELGLEPPLAHTASTAAGILFPETHHSLVRAGIGVYGLWPSRETYLSARLHL
jgi:alanine racemase